MIRKAVMWITCIGLLFSCTDNKKEDDEVDDEVRKQVEEVPEDVKVAVLEKSDFNFELISNGTVMAVNKAELRFLTQETIAEIYVKNGQPVRKGDKLAELDKFKLEMNLAQAEESMERVELDMRDGLIGQGYSILEMEKIPEQAFKLAKIRSNYEHTHNNLVLARYHLDAATLHAPFDGIIANLSVKPYNMPGNDPFCLLINDNYMEVVFHILENELPFLHLNDKVLISPFSNEGATIEGKVTEINPLIDRNGMVRIKAVVSNKNHLLCEGMNVKVRVQRRLGERLVIPKQALLTRSGRKVVFTVKDNRAWWNYVETAEENSTGFVVTDGLQMGDSVIWDGNMNLAHESPIKLVP